MWLAIRPDNAFERFERRLLVMEVRFRKYARHVLAPPESAITLGLARGSVKYNIPKRSQFFFRIKGRLEKW
jgi:hypothetical protein